MSLFRVRSQTSRIGARDIESSCFSCLMSLSACRGLIQGSDPSFDFVPAGHSREKSCEMPLGLLDSFRRDLRVSPCFLTAWPFLLAWMFKNSQPVTEKVNKEWRFVALPGHKGLK